ncbi:MAG: methyltransferase domain-containing protein [Planctomycetes bacterium]|nr:methyltransferase domain-containing protein [Planctomycetota bacterium]
MSRSSENSLNFNARNRDKWVERMAASVPAGARVLDVGAGACPYKPLFSHCRYFSHDFCQYEGTAAGPLRERWEYGRIDYVGDITAIPAESESFDVILCTEVLEHVPEPIAAIREMVRLLRPGGRLLLSAPLGSGLHQQPHHYYGGYTPHFYRKFLGDAGLEIVAISPNGGFYRHLLQELRRAAELIQKHRRYSRWHPAYWLLQVGFRTLLPKWLARLDDEQLIEEFTVGYHVEARKTARKTVERSNPTPVLAATGAGAE